MSNDIDFQISLKMIMFIIIYFLLVIKINDDLLLSFREVKISIRDIKIRVRSIMKIILHY